MKIIHGSSSIKAGLKHPVVTLGNYDGIHRAHQKIIKRVIAIARKRCGTSILYTFEPHPVKILAPGLAPLLLQTHGQKLAMLDALGLDIVIVEPFTKAFSRMSTSEFIDRIMVGRVRAEEIVIGYDFTFGQHRAGGVGDMARLAKQKGIKIDIVDAILLKESLISSTHVRHFIERGNLRAAKSMLGRPYSIEGRIVKGHSIGGELGFHTANLKAENELIPLSGVYITATTLKKSGKKYKSVTNIGYNPTFGGSSLSVETYLIDFKGNLLNQLIEVEFHRKIRREMTFESIEDLRGQITKDIAQARKYYEKKS